MFRLDHQKWYMHPYMSNKVRVILLVWGQLIGLYSLYYLLSLLRLIFKTYKDLTPSMCSLSYVSVVQVEAEPT